MMVEHILNDWLVSYCRIEVRPHTTTHETPSELFLKRKLRTRMDLIKPDVNKAVCAEQAKQKSHYDSHSKSREYFVGQNVQAHNFRTGPRWVAGVIVERLGPLTYLVQVDSGVFWRHHVDHLRVAPDGLSKQNDTVSANSPLQPDSPSQPDFLPVVNSEQSAVVEQNSEQRVTERRYPRRLNRRPPVRYSS